MKDFFLQKPQKPLLVKKRVAKNKLAWWQPLPPVLSPLRGLGSLLAAGIIGNGIALGVLLGILVTAKVANAGQTNNNIIRPTENNL
ncbi:MAG: hypothetical protein QM529_05915, partial [Hydrotalea sp.]|nr:hypothetical protein [Hydrotalea sp.]